MAFAAGAGGSISSEVKPKGEDRSVHPEMLLGAIASHNPDDPELGEMQLVLVW